MGENDINLEEIDIADLTENGESLPPLPATAPEYNEDPTYNASSENRMQEYIVDDKGDVQNYDDSIDWGSLQPVDESGFSNAQEPDYDSLKPYDVGANANSIWDELGVKKDMGTLTEYRGQLARQVASGKLSLEEAQAMVQRRHGDILNKYGMSEVPEFSFAKFKQNPIRACFGEVAEMLPFYWGGTKKGLAASVATVPGTIAKNAAVGVMAGTVEPGFGNAIGGTAGLVKGVVEGVSSGMLVGTFLESMETEGGNLYMDLREKGISHDTAYGMSLAGGITNALLETASFGIVTAPIKGAAKKAAAKMLWKQIEHNPVAKKGVESVIKKCVTEYCKRVGAEVTTEMLQDVTGNVMTLLAAQADSVEEAKPTMEDWGAILKETGPKTAAAMLVMGAIGTPFDVMNAKVGSVKTNGGEFKPGTKEEIEAHLKDHYEGKEVITGESFTLEGRIQYDEVEMSELEAEYNESQSKIDELSKDVTRLEKKKNRTAEESEQLANTKAELKYEQDYQGLISEEMERTVNKQTQQETVKTRKQELTEKGKKEKLTPEELQELNDIWIEEEKTKGEKEINENTQKARERELNKNIRDLDTKIEKVQKKEDSARENRNEIETKQDENNKKISELEKENAEIQRALKKTDIEEDVAEMKTTLSKNRELISELKRNNKALEKQRLKLNAEIENTIAEGEKLGNERASLNEERSQLSEGIINENGRVDITAGGYKNAQLSALAKRLKAMQQGIKRGVRMARREIRDVQNSAIQMIKNSAMSDKDKSSFLTTIRDLNSSEKFAKALPKLINKISELEERHNKKELINYINKMLKKAKPKKGGKTPQGKFNADIQKILDDISVAAKLNETEAYNEIEKIFDSAGDNPLTDEQTAKVRTLYDFGGMNGKKSSELLRNARAIRMLIEEGKIAGQFREQAKKEHKEKILAEAKESIIGDVEPTGNRKKNLANEIKQAFRRFNVISEGWDGLMQIASLHDKDRKLTKLLDVFPSKMARIKGEMESFNKFAKMAMEALNCKNTKQFNARVKKDSIIRDVGTYTDANGNKVTLQASKAEMRKLYMEMQDPTLREQLKNNNGYTFREDIQTAPDVQSGNELDILFNKNDKNHNMDFGILDKSTEELIEENLDPEDLALIDAEFRFYKEYHGRLNAFYREKFGIDMPFNEFYSPIARELDGGNKTEDWLNRESYQKSMIPGNFKNRINSDKKIVLKNDIAVMQEHIANSEHFMAMDKFVTDANTIFSNAEIRDIIRDKYGKNFLAILDKHLKDIANDGVQSTHPEMGMIAKMRNMFTGAALGGRAKILFTQLTAIGVFSDTIPAKDFAVGVADFLRHPRECTKILSESYLLKDRQNSINMEIKDIVRSQEFQAITRYKDFRNSLYFFTQIGDKWSIVAGGWAVYREALNRTGDKAKAMGAFERAVDTYQQSGHIDQLSSWQRGGPFQKALTMFMSDQMKQLRMEVHAVRDAILFKDAEHIGKAAKTVAIMHFILPTLVQFVANGFAWDDEDQLKAAILGPFTSIAVVGQILSAGVALAMKEYGAVTDNENLKDMDAFESLDINIFGPINRLKDEISKLIDKRYKDDISDEDLNEFWANIFKNTIGPYMGIPLKFGFDIWDKTPEYYEDGRVLDLIKLWGGVSPYAIEEKGRKEE
jgi:DNA repair exonuclease SbcCD ATPase subunit